MKDKNRIGPGLTASTWSVRSLDWSREIQNFIAPISISSNALMYLEKCSYFERKLWRTEMSAGELFDKALWIIGRRRQRTQSLQLHHWRHRGKSDHEDSFSRCAEYISSLLIYKTYAWRFDDLSSNAPICGQFHIFSKLFPPNFKWLPRWLYMDNMDKNQSFNLTS